MMERNLNNSSLFTFNNFQQMLVNSNIGSGIIIINVFFIKFIIQVEVHF